MPTTQEVRDAFNQQLAVFGDSIFIRRDGTISFIITHEDLSLQAYSKFSPDQIENIFLTLRADELPRRLNEVNAFLQGDCSALAAYVMEMLRFYFAFPNHRQLLLNYILPILSGFGKTYENLPKADTPLEKLLENAPEYEIAKLNEIRTLMEKEQFDQAKAELINLFHERQKHQIQFFQHSSHQILDNLRKNFPDVKSIQRMRENILQSFAAMAENEHTRDQCHLALEEKTWVLVSPETVAIPSAFYPPDTDRAYAGMVNTFGSFSFISVAGRMNRQFYGFGRHILQLTQLINCVEEPKAIVCEMRKLSQEELEGTNRTPQENFYRSDETFAEELTDLATARIRQQGEILRKVNRRNYEQDFSAAFEKVIKKLKRIYASPCLSTTENNPWKILLKTIKKDNLTRSILRWARLPDNFNKQALNEKTLVVEFGSKKIIAQPYLSGYRYVGDPSNPTHKLFLLFGIEGENQLRDDPAYTCQIAELIVSNLLKKSAQYQDVYAENADEFPLESELLGKFIASLHTHPEARVLLKPLQPFIQVWREKLQQLRLDRISCALEPSPFIPVSDQCRMEDGPAYSMDRQMPAPIVETRSLAEPQALCPIGHCQEDCEITITITGEEVCAEKFNDLQEMQQIKLSASGNCTEQNFSDAFSATKKSLPSCNVVDLSQIAIDFGKMMMETSAITAITLLARDVMLAKGFSLQAAEQAALVVTHGFNAARCARALYQGASYVSALLPTMISNIVYQGLKYTFKDETVASTGSTATSATISWYTGSSLFSIAGAFAANCFVSQLVKAGEAAFAKRYLVSGLNKIITLLEETLERFVFPTSELAKLKEFIAETKTSPCMQHYAIAHKILDDLKKQESRLVSHPTATSVCNIHSTF